MAEARGKAQADTLRKTKTDTIAKRLLPNGRIEIVPASQAARRRRSRLRGRRHHPRRRRSDRRHRHRGRIGDHRRERARHSRVRRRPQRRHRRHQGALRSDQDQDHFESRRNVSRPHDRAGRRRRAAEDAERDRAEHPDRRPDADLPARRGHACSRSPVYASLRRQRARSQRSRCWFRCWSA